MQVSQVDDTPNFRKFDGRAALRTAAYALLSAACLLTSNALGLVALVLIREARRRWIRSKLLSARPEEQKPPRGLAGLVQRLLDSAPGQALLFEVVALAVLSLFTLGWYFAGFRLMSWLP
jgi:hypothetical protein